MSAAVMKALHSLILLISDAYSASLPPNYHPPSLSSLRCNKRGSAYIPQHSANTTRNKYVTLSHKSFTPLLHIFRWVIYF